MNGIPDGTFFHSEHGKPHLEQDQVGKYPDLFRERCSPENAFRVDRWILLVTAGQDK
jgi:hypothetical protein